MKRTNTAKWIESRGRWQINVQKDGIRKTFTSSKPGRTGQLEANRKADRWLDDGIGDTKITVKTAGEKYIDSLKETTSLSNWTQYDSYFRVHITPLIGSVRVENLTEAHLQEVINKAYKKGLSKKTLNNIRACMTAFVKYCRKNKMTTLLPEDITIPNGAKVGEKHILQPENLITLFNEETTAYKGKTVSDFYINAYRFQVLTGLRPGELVGLKWSDLTDSEAYIKRAINVHGEITTGKNDNARRNFTLNALTSAVLDKQRNMLAEREEKSEYVFPRKEGGALPEKHYYDRWKKYLAFHGIEHVTPYELRHTFVSVVKELPEGYLKGLVGHSKDMDTYGVYSHALKTDGEKAAALVQEIFKNILAG